MLLLLVGIALICIRIVLSSSRALLNVAYPGGQEKQGIVAKQAGTKANKTISRTLKTAGGAVGNTVNYFADDIARYSKAILKNATRFVDFLIAIWAACLVALIAFVVTLALLLSAVVGGIWSGAIDIGDLNTTSNSSSDSGGGGGDGKKDDSDDGSSGGGTTEVPKNMDEKEWKRADDIGQKFASKALASSVMPFPGSSGDINNGHLVYQQGNTPVGYYDCSTFISAVYEANGYTHSGKKVKKKYDFKTMKKSNLKEYMTAGGTKSFIKSKHSDAIITKMGDSGWKEKIVPGDIMASGSHIAMYAGKNKDGKQIIAHAGSSSSKVFYDVMLTENGKQVGIAPLSDWMTSAGEVIIYRPSKVVG